MKIRKFVKRLRLFRVWHRYAGLVIAILLFISSITGVLLALKKNIDVIQPPTQKGVSKQLETWKPMHELAQIAAAEFHKAHPDQKDNTIDRMDVRPSKGVAKVLFENGYWEVQIDGTSGEIKSIARRHSDWIEHLHDGSIISDWFKLGAMNILGFGAIFSILTGVWLWYGPKQYRKIKKERRKKLISDS